MFNPTMIRVCMFGSKIGMVIAPSTDEDNYFQVYEMRDNEATYLISSMPYGSQVGALNAFEMWCASMDNGAVYYDESEERVEPHITF
jgi:hypothetical protein